MIKMVKLIKYKPTEEDVVENGVLQIDTVFRMSDIREIFALAHLADKKNCILIFKNEDITFKPHEETTFEQTLDLIIYFSLRNNNKQYIWNYHQALELLNEKGTGNT